MICLFFRGFFMRKKAFLLAVLFSTGTELCSQKTKGLSGFTGKKKGRPGHPVSPPGYSSAWQSHGATIQRSCDTVWRGKSHKRATQSGYAATQHACGGKQTRHSGTQQKNCYIFKAFKSARTASLIFSPALRSVNLTVWLTGPAIIVPLAGDTTFKVKAMVYCSEEEP